MNEETRSRVLAAIAYWLKHDDDDRLWNMYIEGGMFPNSVQIRGDELFVTFDDNHIGGDRGVILKIVEPS